MSKTASKSESKTEARKPAKKETRKASNKKADPVPTDPQEDSEAKVGAFVDIVDGEHKGRYGVLEEAPDQDHCIVRTRDAASERLVVKYDELRPAEAGKR